MLGAGSDRGGCGRQATLSEEGCRKQIDGWLAEALGDVGVGRVFVDLARRADLDEPAPVHDADPGRHRHRLDLVVRDIEQRRAELALDALEFDPQVGAQLGVERREGLVHQEDGRVADQRASDRDPLHLAAGQLGRAIVELGVDLQHARDLDHLGPDRRLGMSGGSAPAAETRDCRTR